MKKFNVENPSSVIIETKYYGHGKCIIEGNSKEEVREFLKTVEGINYFKENMKLEYLDFDEVEKRNIVTNYFDIKEVEDDE